jgi:hypothetical protein
VDQPIATDSPATTSVQIGSVTLTAAPGWRFYPLEDRVIGRPASGVGVIQITRLGGDAIPWPSTHEICMSAAAAASGFELDPPGVDRAKEHQDNCMAGGESFRSGNDFIRIWYRHCPDGMVAAWYGFPAKRASERGVQESIRDCDNMIATMRACPPVA